MRYSSLFLIIMTAFCSNFGNDIKKTANDNITYYDASDCIVRKKGNIKLGSFSQNEAKSSLEAFDLVLGIDVPDTVLVISEDMRIEGDIVLHNNARLEFQSCSVEVVGNIFGFENSELVLEDVVIHLELDRAYQRRVGLSNSSVLLCENSNINGTHDFTVEFWDSTFCSIGNSEWAESQADLIIGNYSTLNCSNSSILTDIIVLESNARITFDNSNDFSLWLTLPHGSEGIFSKPNPADSLTEYFLFSSTSFPEIDYQVLAVNSRFQTSLITYPESNIEILDTELEAISLIFTSPDSVSVSNIVNNRYLVCDSLEIDDRLITMSNSRAKFYNVVTKENSEVYLSGCRIGSIEVCDSASLNIESSAVTGISGATFISDFGNLDVFGSSIYSAINMSDKSFSSLCYVIHDYGELIVENSAKAKFQNITTLWDYSVLDSATVFEADIYLNLEDSDELIMDGVFRVVCTPVSPVTFDSFKV